MWLVRAGIECPIGHPVGMKEPPVHQLADAVDQACSEVYGELVLRDLRAAAERDRSRVDAPTAEEMIFKLHADLRASAEGQSAHRPSGGSP